MAAIQNDRKSPRLDMTPMVDLAFLLLTFFMLTTTFNKPYTMEIVMPEKDETNNPPEVNHKQVVTLVLGGEDKIYWYKGLETDVNQTDYSSDGIRSVLRMQNASIKDMVVLIKPSNDSRYQNIVDILDEMKIDNISRFYLVDITAADLALIKNH